MHAIHLCPDRSQTTDRRRLRRTESRVGVRGVTLIEVLVALAIMALVTGGICLLMSPLLKKWMHLDKPAAG